MNSICNVPGIRVGHAHNDTAMTGCTVILPDRAAVAGVDVRGSAPGTREIELLYPVRLVQQIHAILLSGGSAFGLNAAAGVQKFLEERNIGFDTGVTRVPIVPTAVIYDLAVGNAFVRPDTEMGYQACMTATDSESRQGLVGVGRGATVGKILGQQNASWGGVGTCAERLKNGVVVGVLTVVNALGEVIDDRTGEIIAGVRHPDGSGFLETLSVMKSSEFPSPFLNTNTTLSVVATNASLTRETATKLAQMAQDGLARVIRPAHTMYDGDIVFTLSVGDEKNDINLLGAVACELVAESIKRAVVASKD